jgi:hypothetical protein
MEFLEEENNKKNIQLNIYEEDDNNLIKYNVRESVTNKHSMDGMVPTSQIKTTSYDDILNKLNVHIQNKINGVSSELDYHRNSMHSSERQGTEKINEKNTNYLFQQRQARQQPWKSPKINYEEETNFQTQNSQESGYIFDKFFKNKPRQSSTPIVLVPKTMEEYKTMVIQLAIENHNKKVHLKNTKSKKLIMPIENINIRPQQKALNRTFTLMK